MRFCVRSWIVPFFVRLCVCVCLCVLYCFQIVFHCYCFAAVCAGYTRSHTHISTYAIWASDTINHTYTVYHRIFSPELHMKNYHQNKQRANAYAGVQQWRQFYSFATQQLDGTNGDALSTNTERNERSNPNEEPPFHSQRHSKRVTGASKMPRRARRAKNLDDV